MGILRSKNKEADGRAKPVTKESKAVAVKSKSAVVPSEKSGNFVGVVSGNILLRPRITEKASFLSTKNVFAFEVTERANKKTVAKAVLDLYKVKPVSVKIVKNPLKKKFVRGKAGKTAGVKKAYVYLKEGDKIEII